jgi:hypothetical protein
MHPTRETPFVFRCINEKNPLPLRDATIWVECGMSVWMGYPWTGDSQRDRVKFLANFHPHSEWAIKDPSSDLSDYLIANPILFSGWQFYSMKAETRRTLDKELENSSISPENDSEDEDMPNVIYLCSPAIFNR